MDGRGNGDGKFQWELYANGNALASEPLSRDHRKRKKKKKKKNAARKEGEEA